LSIGEAVVRPRFALAAAAIFNPAIGSLYAWSIFLDPLEQTLSVNRAELSSVFSVAVVCFTLGMTFAPAAYRLAGTPALIAGAAAMCGLGLWLAADAHEVIGLGLAYGVLFGLGAGFGYSVMLQAVNMALPHRRGLANGFGIGLFAAGSILFAPVFGWAVTAFGVRATFTGMATVFLVAGVVAAGTLAASRISVAAAGSLRLEGSGREQRGLFPVIWVGFLLGAAAGLMAISQAAGIVVAYGGLAGLAVVGTTLVAAGNGSGRLAGGWLCDHVPVRRVVMSAHLIAAAALAALALLPAAAVAVAALALVGLSYGLLSGAYPAALGFYYGTVNYGRMMGRLITAWGVAGLSAPWIAGAIFDVTGGYGLAVGLALSGALLAALVSLRLPAAAAEAVDAS
jgi:MFS family permease